MYVRVQTEALEDLADGELIRRFKSADDEALEVLLRRHADDLYRFCCHLVPNRQDAEDIYQESLARAIDRVDSLQSGSAFRGWLFRIARNLSIDSFRSRRRTCPLPDEETSPTSLHVDGPQDHVETGEEYQTVVHALGNLAQSHQRVLLLREVEGLSYADIAHRLNVSQSAVETLLFRARRRLREEYVKSGSPAPSMAALAGLRGLGGRLLAPLLGGGHVAAKLAITAAVVGGAMLTAPHLHHAPHYALLQFPLSGHARGPLSPRAFVSSHTPHQGSAAGHQEVGARIAASPLLSTPNRWSRHAVAHSMAVRSLFARHSIARQSFSPRQTTLAAQRGAVRRSVGHGSVGKSGTPPSVAVAPSAGSASAGDAPRTSRNPAVSGHFAARQRPLARSLGTSQTQSSRVPRRAGPARPSGASSQNEIRAAPVLPHGRAAQPHKAGAGAAQRSGMPAHANAAGPRSGQSHGSGSSSRAAVPTSRQGPTPGGVAPSASSGSRGQGRGSRPPTSPAGTHGGDAEPHGASQGHSARK